MSGRGAEREPDAVRQDLDRTRSELAGTVQELARRVDVPARARATWTHRTGSLRHAVRQPGAGWLALAGAGAAALVVLLVIRGRRR